MKLRYPKFLFVALFFSLCNLALFAQGRDTLHLEGPWRFKQDANDLGIEQQWFNQVLDDEITLPGSMLTQGKGAPVTLQTQWTGSIYDSSFYFHPRLKKYRDATPPKFPFWLTPDLYYLGAAWYQKEVNIPQNWNGKHLKLFLERPHTETIIWLDDQKIGTQNSLVAPHEFDLTQYLTPGKHTITIRVDNRIKEVNVGPDSHSITDHTQGNWNGIVGKIKLVSAPAVFVENVQVYPNPKAQNAELKIIVKALHSKKHKGSIMVSAESFNIDKAHKIEDQIFKFNFTGTADTLRYTINMGNDFLWWDEFSPALYRLQVSLKSTQTDTYKTTFGMRTFTAEGRTFLVNGRPTFLRGTLDDAVFPLTGYAPMDKASWMRIFKIIKGHGLNHVRYHSWCPSKAAFEAADLLGIYLQPEGPSWANHGSALGLGRPIDNYIYQETRRMEYYYGNAPSYCIMAYGNEPRGKQIEYLTAFNNYWKARDSRRLYAGASVGGSWPVIPNNEVMVRGGARDLDWKNNAPQTQKDFSKEIAPFNVPFVTHELGQYCVFPNFNEIEKYTGPYKALNFELFKEDLADHHMLDQAQDFVMASGKLQTLCYKYTIEKVLRTPGYSGYQLLSLNDYTGQGTALVGMLDPFWDAKAYVDSTEITTFCNATVPLAELPKFVYTNNESFTADIKISHYGAQKFKGDIICRITNENGDLIAEQVYSEQSLDFGLNDLGSFSNSLALIKTPQKLTLSVIADHFKNHWEFWVYPESVPVLKSDIYYCDTLDKKALRVLKKGGKVHLNAAGKIEKGKEVVQHFLPVFWNTSWFQMRPPHTTGILTDPEHPIYTYFPTEYHSNLQWWSILNRTQVINLEEFPTDYRPILQPIDTWFMNRRLGAILEVKVGKGKLLITSMPLDKDTASKQLDYSIKEYMNSKDFDPQTEVNVEVIQNIFTKPSKQQWDNFSNDSPDELKPNAGQ